MERKLSNRCVIRFSRALTDAEIKEIYQQFTNSARIVSLPSDAVVEWIPAGTMPEVEVKGYGKLHNHPMLEESCDIPANQVIVDARFAPLFRSWEDISLVESKNYARIPFDRLRTHKAVNRGEYMEVFERLLEEGKVELTKTIKAIDEEQEHVPLKGDYSIGVDFAAKGTESVQSSFFGTLTPLEDTKRTQREEELRTQILEEIKFLNSFYGLPVTVTNKQAYSQGEVKLHDTINEYLGEDLYATIGVEKYHLRAEWVEKTLQSKLMNLDGYRDITGEK